MLKHKPLRLVVVLSLLSFVAAGVVVVATSNAAPKAKTKKLHGHMENIHNTFAGVTPTATRRPASARGSRPRATSRETAWSPSTLRRPCDPVHVPAYSKAHTVIHTKKGNLTCSEAALFDVIGADHAFVDECLITGGTGIYEGATGYIQEVGTFDFAANVGELEYYGKITYAAGAGTIRRRLTLRRGSGARARFPGGGLRADAGVDVRGERGAHGVRRRARRRGARRPGNGRGLRCRDVASVVVERAAAPYRVRDLPVVLELATFAAKSNVPTSWM